MDLSAGAFDEHWDVTPYGGNVNGLTTIRPGTVFRSTSLFANLASKGT